MPDEPFRIKANDRKPVVSAQLGYAGTTSRPDLTGCTVSFIMRAARLGDDGVSLLPDSAVPVKVNSPATVLDATAATVRYAWAAGDTATPGTYLVEWEVHDPDGLTQTFPTDSYNLLIVYADLDGAP